MSDETINLLGKTCDDLQSDVSIEDNIITGTLKYVNDYTGFSGDPSLQEGNYLALKFEADPEDSTISLKLQNGFDDFKPLDSDGLAVLRVTESNSKIIAKIQKGTFTMVEEYDLNLTLEGVPEMI